MNALAQTTATTPFTSEVKIRAVLGILMFLVWKLSAVIMQPVESGAVQLVVYSLLDIVSIITVTLLFGSRRIARDINEINCYSLLAHLIYLPMNLNGTPATLHNYVTRALLLLLALRIMYIVRKKGDDDFQGLPTFGLLGLLRNWQESNHITNKAFNHLPALLFFGSVAPLLFITARSNDIGVTTTVAGLMMFVYFIATMINKQQMANNAALAVDCSAGNHANERELDAKTAALCEIFNARSPEARDLILKFATTDFNLKDHDDFFETKQMTDEAMRLIAQFRDEKHPSLTYQEILVGTTFSKLAPEKQRFILLDAQILRTLEQQKVRQELAEKDAKRERSAKFMKWKFYSGKLAPRNQDGGKD